MKSGNRTHVTVVVLKVEVHISVVQKDNKSGILILLINGR